MADWYVSSANYAAVAVFVASHAYSIGDLVKPTAPAAGREYVFRCTTAGTSATEPAWPVTDNATITSGGSTFTNVSGQSAYGWSAAAGSLLCMISLSVPARNLVGNRLLIASDHSESFSASTNYGTNDGTAAFGVAQHISVNRAGSVPPVAADIQSGAAITATGANLILDCLSNAYWQGITFTQSSASNIYFASSGVKAHYFKDCAFKLTSANSAIRISNNGPCKLTWNNCTVQFGSTGQGIGVGTYPFDFTWLDTTSAIQGATLPATLFLPSNSTALATMRGVDLSALTGNIIIGNASNGASKVLLDSCKIASGVVRFGSTYTLSQDEIELVNCFDSTNTLNERYTPAGAVTTDRSTTMTGGAQDNVGAYSIKLVSSTRADKFAMPLDSFWFDVGNTAIGTSKTATVEIISSASLNNDDISLLLEYMGTSGSPVASLVSSLPTVLTAGSALAASTAMWTGLQATTWNPNDLNNVTLSGGNLVANSVSGAGGVRSNTYYGAGKFYFEITTNAWTSVNTAAGIASSTASLFAAGSVTQGAVVFRSGAIWINNVNASASIGLRGAGSIIGIAFDVPNALVWFRDAPAGNWNGSGTANPATGTGGISISSISTPLYAFFSPAGASEQATINSGASSFSGAVPSGFSSGLPLTATQKLQATFTPQAAGRVRGLVKLGKVSTTVWVNPQVTVS